MHPLMDGFDRDFLPCLFLIHVYILYNIEIWYTCILDREATKHIQIIYTYMYKTYARPLSFTKVSISS